MKHQMKDLLNLLKKKKPKKTQTYAISQSSLKND